MCKPTLVNPRYRLLLVAQALIKSYHGSGRKSRVPLLVSFDTTKHDSQLHMWFRTLRGIVVTTVTYKVSEAITTTPSMMYGMQRIKL